MEYTNPFDNLQGRFYLLKNHLGQLSLWPEACTLPGGWAVVAPPQPHGDCVVWLEQHSDGLHPTHYAQGAK